MRVPPIDGLLTRHARVEWPIIMVYALVDPRNNLARYVGSTIDTMARYRQHISSSRYGQTLRDNWIRGLLTRGLLPTMRILQIANDVSWETAWIERLDEEGLLLNRTQVRKRPTTWDRKISLDTRRCHVEVLVDAALRIDKGWRDLSCIVKQGMAS